MDRSITAVLFLLTFLYSADNQIIAPLLPAIRSTLDTPVFLAGYWGGAYNLAAAISALTVGPWSDRRGRKRFLWTGALMFGGASVCCALAWNFTSMLVFRFLVGFAGGIISMGAQALVGDYFPEHRRGKAMGTVMAGRFLGLSLGVVIGALFAQFLGWYASFWFLAVFGLICAIPAQRFLPQVTPPRRSVTTLPYRTLLKHTTSMLAVITAMLNSAALGGFLFFVGIWLKETFGLVLWQIALVFVLTGVVSFGGSLLSGRYADRYGRTILVKYGNILCAAAYLTIPMASGNLWLAGILFGVLSVAVAMWMAPLHTLITELVPASERGSLVALKNAAALLGIAVTQSIGGWLYAGGGYEAVGLLSAVLMLAGYVIMRFGVPETAVTAPQS